MLLLYNNADKVMACYFITPNYAIFFHSNTDWCIIHGVACLAVEPGAGRPERSGLNQQG
jgi:hypothetical protein